MFFVDFAAAVHSKFQLKIEPKAETDLNSHHLVLRKYYYASCYCHSYFIYYHFYLNFL